MAIFYPVHIKEIRQETANAVSVVFDIPEDLNSKFHFTAGQYITLQKKINGKEVRRAYSICTSPKDNEIRVAIKAVENGTFSVYATTQLKVNDPIEVSAPEGRFLLDSEANKNYIGYCYYYYCCYEIKTILVLLLVLGLPPFYRWSRLFYLLSYLQTLH